VKIVSATVSDSREHEIEDALRSVAPHVDAVLLVDTGATDGTVERARAVASGKLTVVRHEWVDFSAARNASLEAARHMDADWIVIVDSDERMDFGAVDLRAALGGTAADVLLVDAADGSYAKEKIVRAAAPLSYVGPTHEALVGGARETLSGASFSELGKSYEQLQAKFQRDRQLLTAHLLQHPDDPRWWFYLGVSHEGLGDRKRAAEAFGQCAERRRFGNEAAWASYKQADQLCQLERYEEAILAAARGLAADATYGECAWLAGVCAFRLGRRDQAVAWARLAESVGRFRGCGAERPFFRHLPAHYELPYDVLRHALPDGPAKTQAVADFHQAKLARLGAATGRDLDRLSLSLRAAESIRTEARAMLRPEALGALCPGARAARIGFEPPPGWHPMNPSICPMGGKLWCVVRTVNYTMTGKEYAVDDPRGVVRTQNYLGVLTADNALVGFRAIGGVGQERPPQRGVDRRPLYARTEEESRPRRMLDRDRAPRVPNPLIVGYEDVRLAVRSGRLCGSATVCDRDPVRRQMAELELDWDGAITRAVVQPSRQEHEKNWLPLPECEGPELQWIYQLGHHVADRSDLTLDHLRGGAVGALGGDGELLAVAHEVVDADDGRVYLHRFVRLGADERRTVVAVSPAWVFAHHGIEFCAGLAVEGEDVVMTYGIEDREAWALRVPTSQVLSLDWILP
jgi:tetratricopeptide (TPR) repeat protein